MPNYLPATRSTPALPRAQERLGAAAAPAAGSRSPAAPPRPAEVLDQQQALYEELLASQQRSGQPAPKRRTSARELTRELAGWSLPLAPPAGTNQPATHWRW